VTAQDNRPGRATKISCKCGKKEVGWK